MSSRVFAYGRASTDKQQLTQDAQLDICSDWFELQKKVNALPADAQWMGFFFDEAVSSKVYWWDRPIGGAMLAMLNPGDIVVCAKFDRACRSTMDWLKIVEMLNLRQIRLVLVDMPGLDSSTPNGRFCSTIIAAVKQLEREAICQRTRDALQAKKRRGIPHTKACPIGWIKVGIKGNARFEPYDPDRKAALFVVRLMHIERLSQNAIVQMNSEFKFGVTKTDFPTRPKGSPWSWNLRKAYDAAMAGFPLPNGDRCPTMIGKTKDDIIEMSRHVSYEHISDLDISLYRCSRRGTRKLVADLI